MRTLALWSAAAMAAGLAACGGAGSSATSASAPATTASTSTATATSPAAAAPPPAAAAVLTAEGWGPVRVAMTEAQALGALPDGWRPDDGSGDANACHFLRSGSASPVVIMVENGRVTRITTQAVEGGAATPRTDRGVGLGSTEAEVRAAYPGAGEEPDRYDPTAKSLYFWTAGATNGSSEYVQNEMARGLRFEVGADGRVAAIHAGGPSIQLAEGCS